MRRHHLYKRDFYRGDWSSTMARVNFFMERNLAKIASSALFCLTLDTLGSALVVFDASAFRRYCRAIDGSATTTAVQLVACFGPALLLLVRDILRGAQRTDLLPRRRRVELVLAGLGLTYLGWYVLSLRGPWLAEQASAQNRTDMWSARLSATVSGIPLFAFLHLVGFAVLLVAISSASLRAFAGAGYLQTAKLLRRFTISVRVLCAVDFILAMASLVTFATGGLF